MTLTYCLTAWLVSFSSRSVFHRHFAYLVMGWIILFTPGPKRHQKASPTWKTLALAAALLVILLLSGGMILGAAQPLLHDAGALTSAQWMVIFITSSFIWRYFVGRKYLIGLAG